MCGLITTGEREFTSYDDFPLTTSGEKKAGTIGYKVNDFIGDYDSQMLAPLTDPTPKSCVIRETRLSFTNLPHEKSPPELCT